MRASPRHWNHACLFCAAQSLPRPLLRQSFSATAVVLKRDVTKKAAKSAKAKKATKASKKSKNAREIEETEDVAADKHGDDIERIFPGTRPSRPP